MALVLVVEDEDVLREMLAEVIEDSGHQPITATNGREALSTLLSEPGRFSLVISDVMMPLMNGIAFGQALKANPQFQHVPLVLMSAGVPPAIEGLADVFVRKPFDIEAIEALLIRYVGAD